jgi:hypothetical protein
MDPIGYWLKQRKAGEATADPTAIALTQMALVSSGKVCGVNMHTRVVKYETSEGRE